MDGVYAGWCRDCGTEHRLARTAGAEAAALRLLSELRATRTAPEGGKMLGVLLADGVELRAFSGQVDGAWAVPGFVPPVARPDEEDAAATLANIRTLEAALAAAKRRAFDAESARAALAAVFAERVAALSKEHAAAKATRRALRASGGAAAALEEASRAEKRARRALGDECLDALRPHLQVRDDADKEANWLRELRAEASRGLMRRIHDGYVLTSLGGRSRPMRDVFGGEMPSGTGDCCAPKLLHHAARRGLRPLGLAEIWWGEARGRAEGAFYPACAEKCAPLLGHLLCPTR